MNKNKLISGECYWIKPFSQPYIITYNGKSNSVDNYIYIPNSSNTGYYSKGSNNFGSLKNIRLATPEEKHWLNECIRLDKFITKDEAMKSFIPEYVECTYAEYGTNYTVGKIYIIGDDKYVIGNNGKCGWASVDNTNTSKFKPSTKEAFEEQNKPKLETGKWYSYSSIGQNGIIFNNLRSKVLKVHNNCLYHDNQHYINSQNEYTLGTYINLDILLNIKELDISSEEIQQYLPDNHTDKIKPKEPEFVLPEKWCIIKDESEICTWFNKQSFATSNYTLNSCNNQYLHNKDVNSKCLYKSIQDGYTEITFEQFKKYVLKEDIDIKVNIDSKEFTKQYSLCNIEQALLKDYDKDDVKDIIKTLNKHLK